MATGIDNQLREEATITRRRETQQQPWQSTMIMIIDVAVVECGKQQQWWQGWTKTAAAEVD